MSLSQYVDEIHRHPLLTREEEAELTTRYAKDQDPRVAARLVTANLRLVVKIAYEYRRSSKNILDLVQEGNLGLMQAVRKFDPTRGVKLSSYAAWWIRAYILRYILNNHRLVKVGTTQAQRKLFFNLKRVKARFAAMGQEQDIAEIAKILGVEEADVVEMDQRLASGETSLDAPVGDSDGRESTMLELLPGNAPEQDSLLDRERDSERMLSFLKDFRRGLHGTDLVIFDRRMVADTPLTLQEIGDQLGISRERVRQLESRLTRRIKDGYTGVHGQ